MDDLKERVIKNEVKTEMLEKSFIKLETELKSDLKELKAYQSEQFNIINDKLDKNTETNAIKLDELKERNIKNDGTILGISKTFAILAGISGGLMAIIKLTIDILK